MWPLRKKNSDKTSRKPVSNKNGEKDSSKEKTLSRCLIFLVLAATISLLTSFGDIYQREFEYSEGDITDEKIIAPFDFHIYKTDKELTSEKEKAESKAPLSYRLNEEISEKRMAILQNFLANADSLSGEWASFLQQMDEDSSPEKGVSITPTPDSLRREYDPTHTDSDSLDIDIAQFSRSMLESFKQWNFGITESNFRYLLDPKIRRRLEYDLKSILDGYFTSGIIDTIPSRWAKTQTKPVTVFKGTDTIYTTVSNLMSLDRCRQSILNDARLAYPEKPEHAKIIYGISENLVYPNLLFDGADSESILKVRLAEISPHKGLIFKGEMIIDSHTRVTRNHLEILNSMVRIKRENELRGIRWTPIVRYLGQLLVVGLFVLFLGFYLNRFRPAIYADSSHLMLLSLILFFISVVAAISTKNESVSQYVIPVMFGTILTTLLFDVEFSLLFTMATTFIVTSIANFNFQLAAIFMIGGVSTSFSIRRIRKRQNFYRSTIVSFLAILGVLVGFAIIQETPLRIFITRAGYLALNAFFCTLLAIEILPWLERIFGLTTNLTLFEYADLNNPFLRRMGIEAPGTYHHSILVGNLAEAAAEAIGANSLLARVGAYYHDIGKIPKAEYFIENQQGYNKHEKLVPRMSSLIIASHVKEGIEMGRREKLPRVILDIIQQHHGTSTMAYFYQKALEAETHRSVTEEDYRYAGPKPQTREAAIVMLADCVEATSRAMKDPTPSKIKGMAKKIIQSKFLASELDESNLTLKELNKIAGSLTPILTGIFHQRIDYPEQKSEKPRTVKTR